ncbi:Dehydration-responsive element-binding protein 1D [Heracleum sosnowskyi]|uniref:Dehydration-responsive element-binding protein 1D n=1 Tax=Heracleum sosnowskyi TaxID=360622 RepID=A0AAD8MBE8_9APIA|nr:Dehydration-responsive element-binding protein 1D [Heracleum sosnowskyi]
MDHFFSYSTSSYSDPPQDPYYFSNYSQSSFPTEPETTIPQPGDPYHCSAYSQSSFTPQSNANASEQPINISDDEVLLASNNPKKRDGRKKFKETRHPVYRGVRSRNPDKWVSEVREPNKNSRIWLGTFPTAEMAARAHDVAVIALRGRSACLNFADSAWRLPIPASTDAKDIQKAAAEAAEAFRPPENDNAAERTSPEETYESQANEVSYMDEEAMFGTPEYINNMAQGLMLPPPQFMQSDMYYGNDDMDGVTDLSLWSF